MSSLNTTKVQLADLRCRIDICGKTETPDGIGGLSISYGSPRATVWGSINDWKGKEFYRAERTEGLVYHQIIVRASTTVYNSDVLVYGGRTFAVKFINQLDEGKLKYLEIICVEGDPVGGASPGPT
jgi:SPP1 family predicted phage head-tail adaptor